MFKICGLNHVSVVVANTDVSLAFYSGILGMVQVDNRPDLSFPGAWLALGEHQIHLLEVENVDPTGNRPEHGGRDRHIALNVTGLDELVARLSDEGINFTLSKSGRKALFCRDPDGNTLELIEQ